MKTNAPAKMSYDDLYRLLFEDLPADSEKDGFGRNAGSKSRTQEIAAFTRDGTENAYQVRVTRHEDPVAVARRLAENAEERLEAVQATSSSYKRLDTHARKADRLQEDYRIARKTQPEPAPDKVVVKKLGRTPRQREIDAQALNDDNSQRDATAFLTMMFEDDDIQPNATQWKIMADFLEGVSRNKPFFFMGAEWFDALNRGGAVIYNEDEKPMADGDAWRESYHAFRQR